MSRKPEVGRRDFMRVAGVVGAGMSMAASRGEAAADGQTPAPAVSFRETNHILLKVDEPSALAVDGEGRIYAAGENVVVAMDAAGNEIARYAVKGRPGCLAASPDGRLLVGLRNHVEVLDSHGAPIAAWQDLGDRACLTSIAADEARAFVADAGNRIVLHFDLTGTLRGRIGERDPARNAPGLVVPSPYFDVAFDPMGSLWVVNPGKHGLENYRENGELVSAWYRTGMDAAAFCGCCNPIHIAFRSDGSLVTVEKGLNRVKAYAPDTTLLGVVATPEDLQASETASLFCNVEPPVKGLAVDQRNRVLVLHNPQKTVRVFEQSTLSAENKAGKV